MGRAPDLNRKVGMKVRTQKTLSIMIITALVLVIGCGDGKRSRRERTNRGAANGKTTNPGNQNAGNQNPGNPDPANPADPNASANSVNPGGQNPSPDADPLATSPDTAAKNKAKQERITAIMQDYVDNASTTATSQLPDGTYTFSGSLSKVSFKGTKPGWVEAVSVSEMRDAGGQRRLEPSGIKESVGTSDGALSDAGRIFALPGQFRIDKGVASVTAANQRFQLTSKVKQAADLVSVEMEDILEGHQTSRANVDVLGILNGKTTTEDGKSAISEVIKLADGTIRIKIAIDENGVSADPDSQAVNRVNYLTYTFTADPATEAASHATTEPVKTTVVTE